MERVSNTKKSKEKSLRLMNSRLVKMRLLMSFFSVLAFGYEVNASVESIEKTITSNQDLTGVFEIGSFVKLSQDLNLRRTPGGDKVSILLKGEEAQIVATHISSKGHRYYQIFTKGILGFVYSGQNFNYSEYLGQTWRSSAKRFIARPGDVIKIKNVEGISIRIKPGKKRISIIPQGRSVTVRGVEQGKDGKIYYKINHRSYRGYIYAGNLRKKSVLAWTEVL